MWEDIKAFFAWVYNWITVLVASTVGGLSFLLEMLTLLSAVDLTTILPAATAGKIITAVAIAKGVLAWYLNKHEPSDA